jgi:hypothetical protein
MININVPLTPTAISDKDKSTGSKHELYRGVLIVTSSSVSA